MEIQQLFDDFQYYRKHTAHYAKLRSELPVLRDLKLTDERKDALSRMTSWCEHNGLDPRWYLYSLFSCRNWRFCPKWEQLTPGTKKTEKKAIARYHLLSEAPLYSQRISEQIAAHQQASGQVYDPNRDLSNTTENIKRSYLAVYDTDRCMDEMTSTTLGYHPRSTVCARCPARAECERRLQATVPFDIVALRRGDLSVDEAKRIAGRANEYRR